MSTTRTNPDPSLTGATSVVTIVQGRTDHLANLVRGLQAQHDGPVELVVVRMGGPDLDGALADYSGPCVVVEMAVGQDEPLPLAAARNRGAEAASGSSLIFLDVDCIPGAGLVGALRRLVGGGGRIGSAQVRYLPPGAAAPGWDEDSLSRAGRFHPVRPEVQADERLAPELLWTLAIGLVRDDFEALGGLDESYVGYGAEDTDFGLRAAEAGLELLMVADAHAFHQHHPSFDPPLQHLDDLVANARRFHERWHRWPMEGWLAEMATMGVIEWTVDGPGLSILRQPTTGELRTAGGSGS